jgi:leucyl/phenylalanyl-tRNA--protein transferase
MAESAESPDLFWVDPTERGILPLDGFHVSRRLSRSFLRSKVEVRIDTDFAGVVEGCSNREETWINPEISKLYLSLQRMGFAHSVEIWNSNELAGGLYGVALGGVFFGESMFSRIRDSSKFALIALVARLRAGGYSLLDTQFVTNHLARFGVLEIDRAEYLQRLEAALNRPASFLRLPEKTPHQLLLQLSTQTS